MCTLCVISQFESSRAEYLELASLIEDIRHCTELELVPAAADAALQSIAKVSVFLELQHGLLKVDALWYILPLLLQYDSTPKESNYVESHGVGVSIQIANNEDALLASQALSRLSRLCADETLTPYNADAADVFRALLTPKLASLLKDEVAKDLLSKFNTNLETPEKSGTLQLDKSF